jgi:hypothetical protein
VVSSYNQCVRLGIVMFNRINSKSIVVLNGLLVHVILL